MSGSSQPENYDVELDWKPGLGYRSERTLTAYHGKYILSVLGELESTRWVVKFEILDDDLGIVIERGAGRSRGEAAYNAERRLFSKLLAK